MHLHLNPNPLPTRSLPPPSSPRQGAGLCQACRRRTRAWAATHVRCACPLPAPFFRGRRVSTHIFRPFPVRRHARHQSPPPPISPSPPHTLPLPALSLFSRWMACKNTLIGNVTAVWFSNKGATQVASLGTRFLRRNERRRRNLKKKIKTQFF